MFDVVRDGEKETLTTSPPSVLGLGVVGALNGFAHFGGGGV